MIELEQRLRHEYSASDFPSGSAGYRRFMIARIAKLQAELAASNDNLLTSEKRCGELERMANIAARDYVAVCDYPLSTSECLYDWRREAAQTSHN